MKPKPYCLFPRTPNLFSSLNVQKNMLSDKVRLESFRKAIFQTVTPGDVVIDLGTGTGILAIFAAQAGAAHVYAIEETDTAAVAESVIRANHLESQITVLQANSTTISLPERADILIAELVGHFIFEEGIVEYIADMRKSWLKPNARIIPSSATASLAPLELGSSFQEISFWKEWKNPDLSVIANLATNVAYVETFTPENQLASSAQIMKVDFSSVQPGTHRAKGLFEIQRDGFLDALGGWFHLVLTSDGGISIETGPDSEPTHWKQIVFPLKEPIPVSNGDQILYEFRIEFVGPRSKWRWEITHMGLGRTSEVHEITIAHPGQQLLLLERF